MIVDEQKFNAEIDDGEGMFERFQLVESWDARSAGSLVGHLSG